MTTIKAVGRRRFGSVRKLPSGRFQARYRDETGVEYAAPETFATKTMASRWLATDGVLQPFRDSPKPKPEQEP